MHNVNKGLRKTLFQYVPVFIAVIALPVIITAATPSVDPTPPKPETTAEIEAKAPVKIGKFKKSSEPAKAPNAGEFLTKSMVSNNIPEVSRWEKQMQQGSKYLMQVGTGMGWEGGVWYYDGIKVYYQIAAFTGDDVWLKGVKSCITTYRDNGVLKLKGNVQGYRLFPHGLKMDYLKTGDAKSREAIVLLAKNGAYAKRSRDPKDIESASKVVASREIAYNINCWQTARELGEQGFGEDRYIKVALGHLDILRDWLQNPGNPFPELSDNGKTGFQPFMFALTSEALIRYAESTFCDYSRRLQILESIKEVAELTFKTAYLGQAESFYYESLAKAPAPDLNLLICPVYGWLWHRTGDDKFREMGDKIFAGGVRKGSLEGGKQFSQNYRWSFDFVRWRSVDPDVWGGKKSAKIEKAAEDFKYSLIFPNPFRLSGNSKLTIKNISPSCTFTILNKAGEKIYELNSGTNSFIEWDGMIAKNIAITEGVYTYVLSAKGSVDKKGSLEVKK